MREINASIPFDKRLWREDIAGSKAHADMLAANGIISAEDNAAIQSGLTAIYAEYEANGVPEDLALEDIHMVTETSCANWLANRRRGCTPRGRATIRSRPISAYGCAVRSSAWMLGWRRFQARWSLVPKSMPTASCPASRICRSPSR